MKKEASRKSGFSRVELLIVIVLIVALVALAIPKIEKARMMAHMNSCICNLVLIDCTKQQWALEKKQTNNPTPAFSDIQPYFGGGSSCAGSYFACPDDPQDSFATSYTINNIATRPQCKIVPKLHVLP